jgi:hypothetical protein
MADQANAVDTADLPYKTRDVVNLNLNLNLDLMLNGESDVNATDQTC